jgi:hypothetical protein
MVARTWRWVLGAVLAVVLAACTPGGGSGTDAPPSPSSQADPANDGY